MRPQTAIALIASLLTIFISILGCGSNECSFMERCNGNTREVCGAGPDQLVGREISEQACEGDNPICVEFSNDVTACVSNIPCTADTYEDSCDGDTRYICRAKSKYYSKASYTEEELKGWVEVINCTSQNTSDTTYTCNVTEYGPRCEPVVSTQPVGAQ